MAHVDLEEPIANYGDGDWGNLLEEVEKTAGTGPESLAKYARVRDKVMRKDDESAD